ncbi:MFS transporter [Chitinophaga japonensis]|nr:MFS transporter [Chitinophaga japonensis]
MSATPSANQRLQPGIVKLAGNYRASFSGLSKETWLLGMIILINRSGTMVVPFLSMYITQSLHRGIADAGLVITLFGIGALLGSAASGYFIDRVSFRAVQIFTSIAGGLLFLLMGQIGNFTLLCVMTVVLSFVAEAFRPANTAAVTAYATPATLTRSFTLNRLATNIGFGMGSALGGALAAINYHLLFWVEGAVYIAAGILTYLLLPPVVKKQKEVTATPPAAAAGSPWKDAFLLRFLVPVAAYTTCFLLLFRLVPVYWKEHLHIPESAIGWLLGLNGILVAVFEMALVKYWENRRSDMYYIISGVIATAAGYLLLIMPGMAPMLMAVGSVVFITMGEMMALPFINAVIMRRSADHNRGKYAAAYALAWSVAQVAGPGGGALITAQHGYSVLWGLLIALCLVSAVAFRLLNRPS